MTVWTAINTAYNAAFGVWFALLSPLSSWLQILITALPVTALALLVFRYASNQAGIRLAKDRIKGYLLELWIYKDDLRIMLRAQGQVMAHSLRYLGLAIIPMAIMIVPLAPVIVQIESNFAFRGKEPGDTAILVVTMDSGTPVSERNPSLNLPHGVILDTPALRLDEAGQLLWRLSIADSGQHRISFTVDEQQFERRLVADVDAGPLWPSAHNASDWRVLGSAAERPLPIGSSVISTEVDYDRARSEFLGLSSASWLLLLFTLVWGFALRGAFGVTF